MAVWLRNGSDHVGVADGIVRRDDFAHLVEASELSARAAEQLSEAGRQAIAIVTEAVERARQALQSAEREGERLRREACARGLSEAAARWAEEMTHKAFAAHQSVQRASERLAELVSLAAQRVIEVEDKDGLYRRALRTVSHMTKDSKTLVLHIGSADADYARAAVADIAAEVGIEVPMVIKVDSRLLAGGCVLESDFGVIDASMGLQLEAVRKAISNAARAALMRGEPASRPTPTPTPTPAAQPVGADGGL
jgi:type III secretion protein L